MVMIKIQNKKVKKISKKNKKKNKRKNKNNSLMRIMKRWAVKVNSLMFPIFKLITYNLT